MFTTHPFGKSLLVALCLPGLALVSQQRVPVQSSPAAQQAALGSTPSPGDVEKMLAIAQATRMPAGAILPFAGETAPPGYLLCDGTELLRDEYPALFAAIGTGWGFDTTFTFTLPDLRGRFLRGVDGAAGNDPDANTRGENAPGGNIGNNVGSVQGDARRGISGTVSGTTSSVGDHTHGIRTDQDDYDEDDGNGSVHAPGWADDAIDTASNHRHLRDTDPAGAHSHTFNVSASFSGDAETRPKNANVNFIIKI